MLKLRYADEIPVWLLDFRADDNFVRQCVTYAQTAAPEKHQNHITGVFVDKVGESYAIRYEVVLDAGIGAGIPEVAITSLKPYQSKLHRKLKSKEDSDETFNQRTDY